MKKVMWHGGVMAVRSRLTPIEANCLEEFGNRKVIVGSTTLFLVLTMAVAQDALAFNVAGAAKRVLEFGGMGCAQGIADADRFTLAACKSGVNRAAKASTEGGGPDWTDALETLNTVAVARNMKVAMRVGALAMKGARFVGGVSGGTVIAEAAGHGFKKALEWRLNAQQLELQGLKQGADTILQTKFIRSNPDVAGEFSKLLRSQGPEAADRYLRDAMRRDRQGDERSSFVDDKRQGFQLGKGDSSFEGFDDPDRGEFIRSKAREDENPRVGRTFRQDGGSEESSGVNNGEWFSRESGENDRYLTGVGEFDESNPPYEDNGDGYPNDRQWPRDEDPFGGSGDTPGEWDSGNRRGDNDELYRYEEGEESEAVDEDKFLERSIAGLRDAMDEGGSNIGEVQSQREQLDTEEMNRRHDIIRDLTRGSQRHVTRRSPYRASSAPGRGDFGSVGSGTGNRPGDPSCLRYADKVVADQMNHCADIAEWMNAKIAELERFAGGQCDLWNVTLSTYRSSISGDYLCGQRMEGVLSGAEYACFLESQELNIKAVEGSLEQAKQDHPCGASQIQIVDVFDSWEGSPGPGVAQRVQDVREPEHVDTCPPGYDKDVASTNLSGKLHCREDVCLKAGGHWVSDPDEFFGRRCVTED